MLTLHLIMKKAGNIMLENNVNKQDERVEKRTGEAGGESKL